MLNARGQAVAGMSIPPLVHIGAMLKELTSFVDDVSVGYPGEISTRIPATHDADAGSIPSEAAATTVAVVEAFIASRAARGACFPGNWFSDPAWDILLFIYRAHLCGDYISVGDISAGTQSRPTTTIRWIDIIESFHLITRQRCEFDSRRVYIKLSVKGAGAMNTYFASIAEAAFSSR